VTFLGFAFIIASSLLLALERRQARPEDSDARFFRPIWFVIMVIGLMAILLGTFPAF